MTTRIPVDSVRVIALPTFPVRIQVLVQGRRVAGVVTTIRQTRTAGKITVELTQEYPPGTPPELVPFTERVVLEGGFEPGTYLLSVNGYEQTFEMK